MHHTVKIFIDISELTSHENLSKEKQAPT